MIHLFLLILLQFGCGLDDKVHPPKKEGELGGLRFEAQSNSFLSLSENEVSGVGSLRFKEPLGDSPEELREFELHFHLEDKGVLVLASFSDGKLNSGLNIEFVRDGSYLRGRVASHGDRQDISDSLLEFDATKDVKLIVSVDNSYGQVAMKKPGVSVPKGFFFDSRKHLKDKVRSGDGVFWGIFLRNSTIKHVALR